MKYIYLNIPSVLVVKLMTSESPSVQTGEHRQATKRWKLYHCRYPSTVRYNHMEVDVARCCC